MIGHVGDVSEGRGTAVFENALRGQQLLLPCTRVQIDSSFMSIIGIPHKHEKAFSRKGGRPWGKKCFPAPTRNYLDVCMLWVMCSLLKYASFPSIVTVESTRPKEKQQQQLGERPGRVLFDFGIHSMKVRYTFVTWFF